MRLHLATAALAGSIAVSAFALGCNTTVTSSIPPPAGCEPDNSLACRHGSEGWTCAAGDNPEAEESGLSCSVPQADGANDDFCCFSYTTTTTCTPDDSITAACAYPSFGYRCAAGDDPTSLDSTLNCSSPSPDGSDASDDDFCCN